MKNLELPSIIGILEQVRIGDIGFIAQSGIRSGIKKTAQLGSVRINFNGIEGDHQAESFHGGGDRAVLQYDPAHYDIWTREFPENAGLFAIGKLGENLVADGMSENNMCVGDKVRIGTALLQVSQFRQPCFKLNHYFNNKNMARFTQSTGRTGWFYRVLDEGVVRAGDAIILIERPHPEWTILRLQHYVYDASDDMEIAQTLAQLSFLGDEIRGVFENRLTTNNVENWESRLSNAPAVTSTKKGQELKIVETEMLTPSVRRLRLEHPLGSTLEWFEAGAHIDVRVCNAFTRSYSLIHLPDGKGYEIAVRRDPNGRGGSVWMHDNAKVGDQLMVTRPRNFFPLSKKTGGFKLIAGGIGITPLLAMIEQLENRGSDWELRYCASFKDNAPFADLLMKTFPQRVRLHLDGEDTSGQLDITTYLNYQGSNEQVYCCGPTGLMNAVRHAAAHWTSGSVHFEIFSGNPAIDISADSSFTVEISSSGQQFVVSAQTSLLEGLRANGIEVNSECEVGSCGTCRIDYVSGEIDHRDMVLTQAERGTSLMSCVSRARGKVVLNR